MNTDLVSSQNESGDGMAADSNLGWFYKVHIKIDPPLPIGPASVQYYYFIMKECHDISLMGLHYSSVVNVLSETTVTNTLDSRSN